MTGINHMKTAFSISLLTFNPVIIGYSVLSSVLPDIDHYGSVVSRFIFAPYISKVAKHRGFTHSLLGVITICITSFIIIDDIDTICGIVIGYTSHLLADMLTSRGVVLLWPNPSRYKLPLTFTTGDEIESIISNMLVICSICYVVKNVYI